MKIAAGADSRPFRIRMDVGLALNSKSRLLQHNTAVDFNFLNLYFPPLCSPLGKNRIHEGPELGLPDLQFVKTVFDKQPEL